MVLRWHCDVREETCGFPVSWVPKKSYGIHEASSRPQYDVQHMVWPPHGFCKINVKWPHDVLHILRRLCSRLTAALRFSSPPNKNDIQNYLQHTNRTIHSIQKVFQITETLSWITTIPNFVWIPIIPNFNINWSYGLSVESYFLSMVTYIFLTNFVNGLRMTFDIYFWLNMRVKQYCFVNIWLYRICIMVLQ